MTSAGVVFVNFFIEFLLRDRYQNVVIATNKPVFYGTCYVFGFPWGGILSGGGWYSGGITVPVISRNSGSEDVPITKR